MSKLQRVGIGATCAMLVLGAGYSTAFAATGGASNTTVSTTSEGSNPQQTKVSQTDVLNIMSKMFPSLSKLQNPTVSLQPDPTQANHMVYEVDWNQLAFHQQAGPNLVSNYAHATVDADTGDVLQFQNSQGEDWGTPKPVSLSVATKTATNWLAKLAPSKAAKLTLQPTSGATSGAYTFLFVQEVDGIPAPFNQAEVDLDSSGNLVYYSLTWHDVAFPSKPATVLDQSTAQQKFSDSLNLQLQYQRSYDAHGQGPIQLVYVPVTSTEPGVLQSVPMIDATTGQTLGADGQPTDDSNSAAPQPLVPGGPSTFPTPKTEPITQDEGEQEVRSLFGLTGDAWTASDSGQGTSYSGGPFSGHQTWNISLNDQNNDNISATVDATDGVILNYNYNSQQSSGNSDPSSPLTDAQAQSVADAFVKKLFPNMTGAIAQDPSAKVYGSPGDTDYESYMFLVNGVPFRGLQVGVNKLNGQVNNFNLNDDISSTFPDVSKAISSQAAKSAYLKHDPAVLQYYLPEQLPASSSGSFQISYGNTAQLVFAGTPMPYGPGPLNALTGTWITQQPFGDLNPSVPLPKGSSAPDQALALLKEHSIILPGDKSLSAKDSIDREQFIQWLSRAYNMSIGSTPSPQFPDVQATDPYASDLSEAILQGWLKNSGNLNPSAPLTRIQAAQWIVQWMGWSEPAANATYFKLPYSDSSAIPSVERGAATIVSDEGIIPLVNGKFNPSSNLSAGEAAIAVVKAIQTLIATDK